MGVWTVNGKRFDRGTSAGLTALWELAKVKATLEYGGFGFGLELPAAEMLPGDRSLRCSVILAGRPLVGDSGGGELTVSLDSQFDSTHPAGLSFEAGLIKEWVKNAREQMFDACLAEAENKADVACV